MTRSSESRYGSNYGKPESPVPPLVNLQRASGYVARKVPFNSTHCYAQWVQQRLPLPERSIHDELVDEITARRNYVVFSGNTEYALPLFVYDEFAAAWFENTDGIYGAITTKQRNRLRPAGEVHSFGGTVVEAIAQFGYAHVAKLRLERRGKRDWRDELRGFLSQQGTVTGRWSASGQSKSAQQLIDEWRAQHIIRPNSPSAQELYNELMDIAVTNHIGGKKP